MCVCGMGSVYAADFEYMRQDDSKFMVNRPRLAFGDLFQHAFCNNICW